MSSCGHLRIIDAALNRAAEGLRVVEDYLRFIAEDPFLTGMVKELRHDLIQVASSLGDGNRNAARDTAGDVGTRISTDAENQRTDAWAVCTASLKRTAQALRSLEEYGKLASAEFAAGMESLRYRLYTVEKAINIGQTSQQRLQDVRLCVLMDGRRTADEFERLVASLVDVGTGMIQLREKALDDRTLLDRARILRRQSQGTGTFAVVNDRADIAAAADADGVHLGQGDLSVKAARGIVGTRSLIGVSTHNIEQARAAVLDGADYLGAGPTFPSRTKAFQEFAGLDYLREVAAEIRLPTFAIGGIHAENLTSVLATGIMRVAVGSAVTAASDVRVAVRELSNMLNGQSSGLIPAPRTMNP